MKCKYSTLLPSLGDVRMMRRLALVGFALLTISPCQAGAASTGEMTMMSFNVRMGCGLKDPFKLPEGGPGYLPQCAKVIKSVGPDRVALQEIDRCSSFPT